MTPDPGGPAWSAVKELLADALERAPAERAAFLAQACAGDEALRAEVEALLPDPETEERFLARPATELFQAPEPELGDIVGGYRLRRALGEGGMGRVYEATQEKPHRTVALKILRPGFVSAGAERRFDWEVEALARLDHPAIAKVHAAGTESTGDGRALSWFAMELVEGRPLLEAADALGLARRARLELFARICDGVAHAHQRGVIHRDLKPENLLVDPGGNPHVLDFGIARTADPLASAVTTTGEIVGTLAYMSPEQLFGEPERVDARSDVYALGVLLHRLLTGRPPHPLEDLSLPQVALALQQDPPPAGRLDPSLRGDLETILATALATDPARRYATVDRLAADVRCYLADEPISARPPTALYQLAKLARRHRALAAALTLCLLLLVVAVVGTSTGMLRAARALRRAEVDRDRAQAASHLLDAIFASAQPELDGREVRVVDLLDAGGAELDADRELEPAMRASMHFTLGKTYQQLGLTEPAARHFERASELFASSDGPASEPALESTAACAELCYTFGEIERGDALVAELEALLPELDDPPAWVTLRPLELRATRAGVAADPERRVTACRAVLEGWSAVRAAGPSADEAALVADSLDTARNNLAVALLDAGRADEAEALLRASLEERAARLGPDHPSVLIQRLNLASSLSDLGKPAEAVALLEELLPAAEATWGAQHAHTLTVRNNLASALERLGRYDEALARYEDLLAATAEAAGPDHRETQTVRNNVAVAAMHLERYERAERELRAVLAAEPEDPFFRARVEMNLASALAGQDRYDEALPLSEEVVERFTALVGAAHPQALVARNNHVVLLLEAGRDAQALGLARRNLALADEHQPGQTLNAFPLRANLGRALARMGRYEEATDELRAVEARLASAPSVDAQGLARCRELLAETYEAWGDAEQASRWRAAAGTR